MVDVSESESLSKWWCVCDHHEDAHHLIPDHLSNAQRSHYCDGSPAGFPACDCAKFEPYEPVEDECPPK